MQSNTTCPLVEQYLSYLVVIKGRAPFFLAVLAPSEEMCVANGNILLCDVDILPLKLKYKLIIY